MILKGQLHTHTTYSDGVLSPQEVADVYAGLGFDFLAFTDHDHLLKPSYRDVISSVESDLIIFVGIELTVHCSMGYCHVNWIEGDRDELHIFNHPADYDLSVKKTIDVISEIAAKYPLDAVEVTNHGFYTPQFDIEEIPYPKLAADDSHNTLGCGRGWIEVDCERNKDAIIASIRRGDFNNGYAGAYPRTGPVGLQLA